MSSKAQKIAHELVPGPPCCFLIFDVPNECAYQCTPLLGLALPVVAHYRLLFVTNAMLLSRKWLDQGLSHLCRD